MIPQNPAVFNFSYDSVILATIKSVLSGAHLAPYVAQTSSLQAAIDLYIWNEAISSALLFPLRVIEVTLRNALSAQLQILFSNRWFDDPNFVRLAVLKASKKDLMRDINRETVALTRKGRPLGTIRTEELVAQLSFGFWTTLLDATFEPSLWAPALSHAFPRYVRLTGLPLRRGRIAERFDLVRKLRNQISHNNSLIHRKDLLADYKKILEAVDWLNEGVTPWIEHHAQIRFILALRDRPRYII